jgi:hypothetical protein
VGDEQAYFDSIAKASRAKISFSSGEADSSVQAGSQ